MWFLWIQLSMLFTKITIYIVYTVVYCFWFVYLVDAMKRKRNFYKATLRCVQGESDPHEQMLAYNAKTELVKYVSLFCLNLVEWVGFTVTTIWRTLQFVRVYEQEFPTNNLLPILGKWNSKLHSPYLNNVTLVLAMTIAGSLCMYLSARYTQISWITSKRIPLWIGFFLPISVFTQILVTICYTNIIGIWCDGIITTLSVIFAWKQYRKLNMVIQWSIVDLRVSWKD